MDKTFEDRVTRIEDILEALENKEIPLEKSISIYKEALQHIEICQETLENAKNEIVSIIPSGNIIRPKE
ncbi:MAG: exodeoxyribonuclease VII small subunit [Desulfovibrionaceae bacterium]